MDYNSRLSNRNNNFDLLRLVAAFLVLISHCFHIRGIRNLEPLARFTSGSYLLSYIGLAIFFTISGFLICKSLVESYSVKSFLLKRFLRIWPALFFNVVVTVLFVGIFISSLRFAEFLIHPQTLKYFFVNISLLHTSLILPGSFNGQRVNIPLWTIPFEVQLYFLLLLAFLMGLFKRKMILVFAGLLYILFLIGFYRQWFPFLNKALDQKKYYFIWCLYFLAGALLYLYKDKIRFKLSILIVMVVVCFFAFRFLRPYFDIFLCFLLSYSTLFVAYGIPKLVQLNADLSYGIYLYAYPIQLVVEHSGGKNLTLPVYIILVALITIVFAFASWFLIEKKALSFKNRSQKKISGILSASPRF